MKAFKSIILVCLFCIPLLAQQNLENEQGQSPTETNEDENLPNNDFPPPIRIGKKKPQRYAELLSAERSEILINYFEPTDLVEKEFIISVKLTDRIFFSKYFKRRRGIGIVPDFNVLLNRKIQLFLAPYGQGNEKYAYNTEKSDVFYYFASTDQKIPSGQVVEIAIFKEESFEPIHTLTYQMPERPKSFPMITKLTPSAGIAGDAITIYGKHLGHRADNITIQLTHGAKVIKIPALYLTHSDKTGIDEIKFDIPYDFNAENLKRYKSIKSIWELSSFQVKVLNNYYPSINDMEVKILRPAWKKYMFLITLSFMVLFIVIVAFMTKTRNFLPDVLIDKRSNSYSLSKFQAFCWTITLFGSYLFVAICNGVLIGQIPDFNLSLLGLLGISYAGLISSHSIDKRNPKNKLRKSKPSFGDLISQNGEIDITRLQMFGFTLITIFLYFFNLANSNILEGLPNIPDSLHTLLLTSQGGFLGGKLVGDKLAIMHIEPYQIDISDKKASISIIGNGFMDGIKVMLEGYKPIRADFVDPNTITCTLPEVQKTGVKSITIVPTHGNTIMVKDAIEFVDTQSESKGETDHD